MRLIDSQLVDTPIAPPRKQAFKRRNSEEDKACSICCFI